MSGPSDAVDPVQLLAGLRELAVAPAAHVETVALEVRARREQIAAFRAQLETLDEQLAALEMALAPLVEWSRLWTGTQHMQLGRLVPPPAGKSADPPSDTR